MNVDVYDNTSNGSPIVAATFAIVTSVERAGGVTVSSSYVLADSGAGYTYSRNADGTSTFEDLKNGIKFKNCVASPLVSLLDSKP